MASNEVKKILLAGPLPEPTGGVSVHVSRLASHVIGRYDVLLIDESAVFKEDIFNVRSLNFFTYIKMIHSADLIHVHSSVPLLRFMHVMCSCMFRKKCIVTLHSYRKQNYLNRFLNYISLKLATAVIAVSSDIFSKAGVKCEVIPGFISPSRSDFLLPIFVEDLFDKLRFDGRKILVSNASRLDDYCGRDLYGFDEIIKLFDNVKVKENWGAILNVSSLKGCEDKFNQMIELIEEKSLGNNIYLLNEKVSFPAMLKKSDASIRATLTDGDALSVRESLVLGVKTIASDCVERPKGVIVYQTLNSESLLSCLLEEFEVGLVDNFSYEEKILNLYSEHI